MRLPSFLMFLLLLIPFARQEHLEQIHEAVQFQFSKNFFRTGKHLVLLTSNAGQNMYKSTVSYISFFAGRKDKFHAHDANCEGSMKYGA